MRQSRCMHTYLTRQNRQLSRIGVLSKGVKNESRDVEYTHAVCGWLASGIDWWLRIVEWLVQKEELGGSATIPVTIDKRNPVCLIAFPRQQQQQQQQSSQFVFGWRQRQNTSYALSLVVVVSIVVSLPSFFFFFSLSPFAGFPCFCLPTMQCSVFQLTTVYYYLA